MNAAPVSGAPSSTAVDEIVVTAQKRSENAQNVPVAITALSPAQLKVAGVTDTQDLRVAVPALNVTTAIGGFGLPRIRGIGATGQGPGIENPVAVYVDGVYYGAAFGVLQSLFDVDQVAVLKGPQGTLFGRNATGGLIQITTLNPTQAFNAKGEVGYGNYGTFNADGFVSGGLTKTLAFSVSGQYEDRSQGFGTNVLTGKDVNWARTYAARAKLLWEPTGTTSVLLSGDVNNRRAGEPALRQVGKNTLGQLTPGSEYDINADVDPLLRAHQWGASLTVNQDLGFAKLKSITAYRNSRLRTLFDPDGTTIPQLVIDNIYFDRQFTQEINLVSDNSRRLQWVLGGFYMHDSSGNNPGRVSGLFTFGGHGYQDDLYTIRLNSFAGFAEGTYAIDDATKFVAGLRYTSDQRDLVDRQVSFNGNTNNTTVIGPIYKSHTYGKPTWRISLDHRFSPELLVYASYNRGFRGGTYTPAGTVSSELQPEVVDAYEIGLKSDLFDRKIRFNIAGFYYNQHVVQVQQIVAGRNNVYDADGAHIYGLDADLSIKVSRNFNLFGGLSYVHARYTSFTTAVLSYPYPLPAGFVIPGGQNCLGTFGNPFVQVGGNCLLIGNASGAKLQNTPTFTASIGGSYDIVTDAGKFTLAGNFYHNSGFLGSIDGRIGQKAYNIVDGSLTWRPSDKWYVRVWGKNLTNAFFWTQIGASNSGDNGTAGAPRTYGAAIGIDF